MKNFNVFLSAVFALCLLASAAAHAQNATVTTPRGTSVPAYLNTTEPYSAAELAYMTLLAFTNYPFADNIAPATGKYNCHSFAWHSQATTNNKWLDSPSDDKYWLDGSYTFPANQNTASRWSYVNGDHSAMAYPAGQSSTFRSKWGAWPRMFHTWSYCPYDYSSMLPFETCATSATAKAPGFVYYINLTSTTVSVKWTRACNAAQYQVQYKLTNSSTWNGLTVFNASTAQHLTVTRNITGMTPNTCYNFRVKVINGPTVKYSPAITVCTNGSRPADEVSERKFEEMPDDFSMEPMLVSNDEATDRNAEPDGVPAMNVLNNPSNGDNWTLETELDSAGEATLELFDFSGRLVSQKTVSFEPGEQLFDIENGLLPGGMYVLNFRTERFQASKTLMLQ